MSLRLDDASELPDHTHRWSGSATLAGMAHVQPETSDDRLVARYAAGDADAFDSLYARYSDRVWRYAFRSAGFDQAAAADVCQDTWLRVIKGVGDYRASGRFDRWLFGIAHNVLVDRFRKADVAQGVSSELEAADLTDFVRRFEVTDNLEHALSTLSAEQRSALLLHYVEGHTLDEIAQLENSGRETVKSRLRYGLKRLRQRLGGEHGTH
ncbi:MAG: sigma-70 family RNA polymerase sigma factor [Pseudomonadota bacterium]